MQTPSVQVKKNIAIFIAILFHVCGAIGILFTPYKDWFIANTPFNLLLMVALLFWVQERKNIGFFLFFIMCFLVGMGTEMIGVNTGRLFGSYHYGTIMGKKLNGVPFLIGINWFMVVFCAGTLVTKVSNWVEDKYDELGVRLKPWMKIFSLIFDGALLATLFDFNIEPVAIKLSFWQWKEGTPPVFNFICWFVISANLMWLFKILHFDKDNQFAVHLLIIQALFFITLQVYLP
jgi:putative membrane protein